MRMQGLSSEALREAEEAVNGALGGRVCYLVVKNGAPPPAARRLGRGCPLAPCRPGK